jgi:hypothetical protein
MKELQPLDCFLKDEIGTGVPVYDFKIWGSCRNSGNPLVIAKNFKVEEVRHTSVAVPLLPCMVENQLQDLSWMLLCTAASGKQAYSLRDARRRLEDKYDLDAGFGGIVARNGIQFAVPESEYLGRLVLQSESQVQGLVLYNPMAVLPLRVIPHC